MLVTISDSYRCSTKLLMKKCLKNVEHEWHIHSHESMQNVCYKMFSVKSIDKILLHNKSQFISKSGNFNFILYQTQSQQYMNTYATEHKETETDKRNKRFSNFIL